jgi:hypothetical protein
MKPEKIRQMLLDERIGDDFKRSGGSLEMTTLGLLNGKLLPPHVHGGASLSLQSVLRLKGAIFYLDVIGSGWMR